MPLYDKDCEQTTVSDFLNLIKGTFHTFSTNIIFNNEISEIFLKIHIQNKFAHDYYPR